MSTRSLTKEQANFRLNFTRDVFDAAVEADQPVVDLDQLVLDVFLVGNEIERTLRVGNGTFGILKIKQIKLCKVKQRKDGRKTGISEQLNRAINERTVQTRP